MPGIFISYAKENRDIAVKLEQAFKEKKIPVCIEKESIYKKEDWPKIMAEAIAAQNLFILLWSQHTAASQHVQLEATIASKMNKSIIAICLDNTPLRTELAATKVLHIDEFNKTIQTITEKVPFSPPTHHYQNHQIIELLSQTDTSDIDTIIKVINPPNRDSQQNQNSKEPSKSKRWFEKWQTVVTFLVVLLTLLTFVLEIPEKFESFIKIICGETIETLCLKGAVRDEKGGVAGVVIRVDKLPDVEITTTEDGSFKFPEVPGTVGESVRVKAYYNNKMIFDQYITLPGPLTIAMEEKQ